MLPDVVDRLGPGGEQLVQLGQVLDPGGALPGQLDQELIPHSPEESFDFSPPFWLTGQSRLILWITGRWMSRAAIWVCGGRVRDGGWFPRGGGLWRRRLRGCGAAGRSGRPGRSGYWRRGRGRGAPRRRRAGRHGGKGWSG